MKMTASCPTKAHYTHTLHRNPLFSVWTEEGGCYHCCKMVKKCFLLINVAQNIVQIVDTVKMSAFVNASLAFNKKPTARYFDRQTSLLVFPKLSQM